MKPASIIVLAGLVLFGALAELVAALASPWAALALAVALGSISPIVLPKLPPNEWPVWAEMSSPALGVLIGVAVAALADPSASRMLLLLPIASAAGAGIVLLLKRLNSSRCALCNTRLGNDLSFECPRCTLRVCESRCWVPEHLRCRLCLQNEVPVFTDERWWDRQFGPRCQQGVCQHCQASPNDRDLRACRRCGRPQCRQCWDYLDGSCTRCRWVVPELPAALARFMEASASSISKVGERRR